MTKMAKNFKPRKARKSRKPGIGAIRIDDQGRKVYWACEHMTITDHRLAASGRPCLTCNMRELENEGKKEERRGKREDMYRRARRAPGSFESNSR